MDLYLAGKHEVKNGNACKTWENLKILESYYYASKNKNFARLVKTSTKILLDSGAFTFIKKRTNIDWDYYLKEYAEFINKHDIKLFFELDIDPIVGLAKVEKMTAKLEELTNKKPIPVWHKNRGKEYYLQMCKNYPYIALGGIALKEIPRKQFETLFPWFITTAHKYGCKLHGLGYTGNLHLYKFDSVDSSAWLHGNLGGYLYNFNPSTKKIEQIKKEGYRVKTFMTALHNFNEWVKYSKYAELYL